MLSFPTMGSWLLLLFLPYIFAQTTPTKFCPSGYQDGQNGFCYKPYINAMNVSRDAAVRQCNFDGGRLPTITNAFTNTFLQNLAMNNRMPNLWIGLVCQTASKTSCQFDGASTPLSTTSYSNFYQGYPSPSHGPFVILKPFNGIWFTASYDHMGFICEVPIGNPPFGCSQDYQEFENNCYKYAEANSSVNTEAFCEQDDGHIASIHSAEENSFILNLAKDHTVDQSYYRIGLKSDANDHLSWSDGSNYDYNNFGLENNKYGSCVAGSFLYATILPGQWISSNCDSAFPSVSTESRYPPYNPPSTSSRECPRNTALNGGGTFYSPNYPNAYSGDSSSKMCSYVMTSNRDIVTITFPEMNMESGSYISLYNDVTDTVPFVRIYSDNGLGKSFNSTGPVMLMTFVASYQNYNYGKWMAFYY